MAQTVKIVSATPHLVHIDTTTTACVGVTTAPVTVVEGASAYTGTYTVTPDVEPITLATKDKLMADDVTVKKIPLWETSNTQGGTTILIGGDKYYGLQ